MPEEQIYVADQKIDYPLDRSSSGPFRLRHAFYRSKEWKSQLETSQDFLAYIGKGKEFSFVLCDGVSQSYYGDFAARFVGLWLLDWLWELEIAQAGEEHIANGLRSGLSQLRERAERALEKITIPESFPELMRQVLEEKRRLGSETAFACGKIALQEGSGYSCRLLFAWLGNIRIRLGMGMEWGDLIDPRMTADTSAWSTRKGFIPNRLGFKTMDLPVSPEAGLIIVAYTDGLKSLDVVKSAPNDKTLLEHINTDLNDSFSDDCSLIEIKVAP